VVSGRVEHFNNEIQITHPDHVLTVEEAAELRVEPVYGLTAGVTPRVMRKAVAGALDRAPALPEWLDPALRQREGWGDWRTALSQAHMPESEADITPDAPARRRLAYDELLAGQLAIAMVRAHTRRLPGRNLGGHGRLRE